MAADQPWHRAASLGVQKAGLRNLVHSIDATLEPDGIRAVSVTVRGTLSDEGPFTPDRVAEAIHAAASQDPGEWRTEIPYTGDDPLRQRRRWSTPRAGAAPGARRARPDRPREVGLLRRPPRARRGLPGRRPPRARGGDRAPAGGPRDHAGAGRRVRRVPHPHAAPTTSYGCSRRGATSPTRTWSATRGAGSSSSTPNEARGLDLTAAAAARCRSSSPRSGTPPGPPVRTGRAYELGTTRL